MPAPAWLRSLFGRPTAPTRTQRRGAGSRRRARPIAVESLEDRTVPTHAVDFITTATSPYYPSTSEIQVHEDGSSSTPTIDSSTDVDIWAIYLNAGDTVLIDTDARDNDGGGPLVSGWPLTGAPGLDTYLRLFDSSGNQLAASDDSADPDSQIYSYDSFITYTAGTSGTYYFGVSSYANTSYNPLVANSGSGSGATGPYQVELRLLQASVGNATVTEGASGITYAGFTVSLSGETSQYTYVYYSASNNTAAAGSDYGSVSGTVTFSPGQTSQTVYVPVYGDTTYEPTENFFLNLTGASGADIGNAQGVGTIINDDGVPVVSIGNAATVGEGGTAAFTVTLSNPSYQPVSVNYTTANGSAVSGADYTGASGTVTIPAGSTSQTIYVSTVNDSTYEATETFFVNLSAASGASILDGQGVGTIADNDPLPAVSVNDVSVTEGGAAVFTVSLSNPSYQTVSVNYTTANGSAVAGSDYTPVSSTVTFPAGTTSQSLTVATVNDSTYEPTETFTVSLTGPGPGSGTVGPGSPQTGIGTITDNDPQPTVSVSDATVTEGGQLAFTVTLSNPSYQTITAQYLLSDGTAQVSDGDYQLVSGTVSFSPGVTTQTVTVQTNADTKFETDETLTLILQNPVNASVADGQGVGTITNDDPLPTVSIADAAVTEGNTGSQLVTFTVTLSNPTYQTVTVDYATADGTALLADADYAAAGGTLTFAPGVTTRTLTVQVNGDSKFELDDAFAVNLSAPSNASIADGQGVGTIVNDDAAPTVSISDAIVTEGGQLAFAVSLSNPSYQTVTVDWATADLTALLGDGDYTADGGTVTFAPDVTAQTVTVQTTQDAKFELDDQLAVNLTNAANVTGVADGQGVGTILNDDAAPTVSVNDVSVTEGGQLVFTVTLSNPSYQTVTVDFSTADLTALVGDADYAAASGTLTFAPDAIARTVAVQTTQDAKFELNDELVVNLSNAVNATGIADPQGVGTIANDDLAPTISINDVSVTEGNSGLTTFTFTVTLSNPSYQTVTVNYATANGSALTFADYFATAGALTFAPDVTSRTFTVSVVGDLSYEADEQFLVNLSGATNATVADGQGVGTIQNDDSPNIGVGLTADPCEPGKSALVVRGSQQADTIVVSPVGNTGAVAVSINGVLYGSFSPTGRIIVLGQDGNDDIQIAGSIALPAWLYGEGGDDRLKGGDGYDVLLGGTGADLLAGGGGRDLLIGGLGADRIVGNADDDVLVSGTTLYDTFDTALCAVMDEWTSNRTYGQRVANLSNLTTTGADGSTFASRENQGYFLWAGGPAGTVLDDSAADVVTGSAGQDWFLIDVDGGQDKATDLSASEFATDLTWVNNSP